MRGSSPFGVRVRDLFKLRQSSDRIMIHRGFSLSLRLARARAARSVLPGRHRATARPRRRCWWTSCPGRKRAPAVRIGAPRPDPPRCRLQAAAARLQSRFGRRRCNWSQQSPDAAIRVPPPHLLERRRRAPAARRTCSYDSDSGPRAGARHDSETAPTSSAPPERAGAPILGRSTAAGCAGCETRAVPSAPRGGAPRRSPASRPPCDGAAGGSAHGTLQ